MTDLLDQVLAAADPLVRRVDEVLNASGAPDGHALWTELRRVRLLPGDAARAVAALDPAPLSGAADALRADARTCADAAAELPPPDTWTGEAAEAYDDLRRRTAARLSGTDDSLDERWEATADLADALADWMSTARSDLAVVLAEVMISAEAVTLVTSETWPATADQASAAAAVGTRILRSVAASYADADDLLRGSAPLASAIPL
ncbi:hypothetical protein HH310_39110 [Actinoplanes sp. TBRC 11911]|uniref:hypothetical protein n=1 Tax=Actinoplanes sp. TBRC 11911 TaxID=2729386 RepID=UPI00145EF9BD|nr:hypothetical protein [Actinoplanes sp. TBRC 11911]NMO57171.1 hypothetical protein [Actinoplanes sp. TBRC 11911]